jgi:SAM-dependent methyltransferase
MEQGQVWEEYARAEPYWAVLTEDRFVRSQMTDDRHQAFFDTGRSHVAGLLTVLRRHFDASFSPARVLDFGSGAGRLALPFAELGAEVLGLDVSPSMVAEASQNAERFGLPRCRFEVSTTFDWASAGQFDLVHSFIVFQHIPESDGQHLFDRLIERLAPGGIAALQVLFDSRFVPAPPPSADAPVAERPCSDLPPMLMATYNMNRLLATCNALGSEAAYLRFTNHGPYAGCFVCVQRPR